MGSDCPSKCSLGQSVTSHPLWCPAPASGQSSGLWRAARRLQEDPHWDPFQRSSGVSTRLGDPREVSLRAFTLECLSGGVAEDWDAQNG